MPWTLIMTVALATALLDGNGAEHPVVAEDRADGGLLSLTARLDDDALWLGLEFDQPVDADEGSGLVLHLDADADPTTGDAEGSDLVFDLQARHGSLHPPRRLPGHGRLHERLGLVVTPAFTSPRAEVYLPASLLPHDRVRLYMVHAGDRVPDEGFVEVTRTAAPPIEPLAIHRMSDALRLASWNLERDGFFDPDRTDAVRSLLAQVDPDVLVVCEAFDHDGPEALERAHALGRTQLRHAVKADPGNVVLSRYPIVQAWSIIDPPDRRNGHRASAVLLDTPHGPFMVLPAHWRCCNKDGERLFEADATVAFLREAFTEGGNFTLPSEPPFVICGDLNLVKTRRPLDVVLTGSVVDKDSFSPDFPAGPGRTPLGAVSLRHTHAPVQFTWRPDGAKYYASRLDWVLVPSSVRVRHGYVLDTATMPADALRQYGLQADTSARASDHAMVVVDVEW